MINKRGFSLNRDRLLSFLDAMKEGVYVVNESFDIEYVNAAVTAAFGPVGGAKCYTYLAGRSTPCPGCREEQVFDGNSVRRELACVRTGKVYDCIDAPLVNSDGSVSKLKILRDITDRKLFEQQVKDLAKFPEENPNPVLRIAQNGKILYSNVPGKVLLEKWGITAGQNVPARWNKIVRAVLASGRTTVRQIKLQNRIFSFVLTPVAGAGYVNLYGRDITKQKETEKAILASRDDLEQRVKCRTAELAQTVESLEDEVSQRIRAEKAMEAERQRFEELLEMMPAYVILLTPDYHVAYANRTFRECFGESNGKRCYEFLFDRTEPCETCESFSVLKTCKAHFWEWSGPNGRCYDIYDYPYTDADGSPLIMEIGLDVTAHKQALSRIQLTNTLMELFTKKTSRQDYLDSVVQLIGDWSGCQCVGIRLTDSDGCIPYASSVGFSDDFLAVESSLSLKDNSCLCIRAITQTPDSQDIPLVTPRGAFCCENASRFIDALSDNEKSRYRGTCLRHGFTSLAVIPVRYRDTILGAIHLADAREGIIPLERIEFFESVSMLIGEAVHRFDVETELRESEERYRLLVELSPEAICMSVDDAIVYVNPMAVALMRAESTDAMTGRSMWEFIHPDSRDIVTDHMNELSDGDRPFRTREIKVVCLDGSALEVEVSAAPITVAGQTGILALFHDITDRRRQQQALQVSKSRLLEAQRVAHLGNWEWDIVTDELWWSNEVYRIFGLSPQQLAPTYEAFLSYVHPEDRNLVEQAVSDVVAEGKHYSLDHRVIRPDGVERIVHEQGEVVYGASHKPIRMIGTVHDITDRVRAEEAVRKSEERFRLMAQATDDVFWMSTPGIGQMLYISPAYEKIWGKTRRSLYQNPKSFLEGVHPEDRDMLVAGMEGHAKGTWNFKYRVVQPDGSVRCVHDVGYPVRNERGELTMMAGMIRDITEQNRAETEILEKQKELQSLTTQLQLTEERERRRIAQDLHDSIGQILSFSGRELKSLGKLAPKVLAEPLLKIAEQMDIAVEQARTLSFDLSPALLYDLGLEVAFEDMADRMSKERNLKCSFETCSSPKPLSDDVKVLLYRSVRELLINAAKHAGARSVKISCLRSASDIHIKVEDDGCGFDVSMLKNRTGRSKGFGLFSLHERLNHIGGRLTIESQKGRGTTAILIAPLNMDLENQKEMTNEQY